MGTADNILKRYSKIMGGFSGVNFNIYRPDYTSSDNTPVLVYENVKYLVSPSTGKYSEPRFKNVDWYTIAGDRSLPQPGDLFIKSVDDGGQTPVITYGTLFETKAFVGFRTARLGNLTNESDDIIYENVYFDFVGESYPGSSINRKLEDSLRIPSVRVMIWNRAGLFRLRTQLIETDSTQYITKDGGAPVQFQRKWQIGEIQRTGNFAMLTLQDSLSQ